MVTLDLIPRGRGLSNLVSGEASGEILLAGCWIKLAARSVGGDHRAFGDKDSRLTDNNTGCGYVAQDLVETNKKCSREGGLGSVRGCMEKFGVGL
mgnify:CR=1 FL=1